MRVAELTGAMLKALATALPEWKAGGLDGWTLKELKLLPSWWWDRLAELLGRVEDEECWPAAHLQSYLSFISKGAGEEPLAQRPLSILTLVFRLWAAVRLGQVNEWSQQWLHRSALPHRGGRQTRSGRGSRARSRLRWP